MFQIYAIVDSSDGELHGEKAVIYVRTDAMSVNASAYINNSSVNDKSNIIATTIQSQRLKSESRNEIPDEDLSAIKTANIKVEMLDVRAPYFDDNNLKTVVSWFRNGLCNGTRVKYTIRLAL